MWMKFFAALTLLFAHGNVAAAQNEALPEPALEKIAEGVWIHKSYGMAGKWGKVLSQGLVVKNDGGVFLVDTAWNDADTEKLLKLIEAETDELPKAAIVTHAHADKMGGMGALHAHDIKTFAHAFSNEDAPARGLAPATTGLSLSENAADASLGDGLTILYPGAGHTRDNTVVYYAPAKVAFAGCLIRPGEAKDMGNTADGDVGHWAQAVRNVADAFPDAEIVIPSHGPMGGRELLDHTIELAEAAAAQ